ncbi:hypothetical protein QYE76_011855 [Lolium multiflorum]|uniref:Pectinesterase n=1 Tax=Lolium multiflorum TaxID=4521 RepID=A0AAD8TZX7_LOLMU|nr:hypothetical protein QYE76_011855 [Lolium multiflorum]
MTKLGVSTTLATLALAIGAVALALTATAPRGCDAAGGVVRSIFVNNKQAADFKSVQAAIDSIPLGNNQWIRIHVAAGVYFEKVLVPLNKSFILLEGEGKDQTFIEWADHAGGDTVTASSPTFTSYPTDFMARDISFKNTYDGVSNMAPAVAALVAGDRSSFYRCGFISVQDTLSDLFGRHYYENCYIEGSTDFIFGNGQTIFQGCEVSTGRSAVTPGFITAHGRNSAQDGTGFVFNGGKVSGVTPAYLGRAWRAYARVIFYQTDMSDVVVSQGWDAWNYKGQEGSLTMVESGCTGKGSNTTGRVPWEKTLSSQEIANFVNVSYVSADGWLAAQPR